MNRLIFAFVLCLIIIIFPLCSTTAPLNYALSKKASKSEPIKAIWLETSANLYDVLKDKESIERFLDKVEEAGFNTIIAEAKNSFGHVIFKSKIAPRVHNLKFARTWPPCYPPPNEFLKEDFDILAVLIEEAHKRNLKIFTAVNIFSEGLNAFEVGPAFSHPEWQSVFYTGRQMICTNDKSHRIDGVNVPRGNNQLIIYTPDKYAFSPATRYGIEVQIKNNIVVLINDRLTAQIDPGPLFVPKNGFLISAKGEGRKWILDNLKIGNKIEISELEKTFIPASETGIITFVNPGHSNLVNYELSILEELTRSYNIDGIVLDRMRYSNIFSDFSASSKTDFENYLGYSVANWPEDIILLQPTEYWFFFEKGPLFNQWVSFRAKNIQSFVIKAEKTIKEIRPDILFINYVAGWYPRYWNEGVNWAAIGYQPKYTWADRNWPQMGIADFFDYLIVGVYYEKICSRDWHSVQGGIKLTKKITGKTKIITGLSIDLYKENLQPLLKIIKDHKNIMIFDTSYIERYDLWKEVKKILKKTK